MTFTWELFKCNSEEYAVSLLHASSHVDIDLYLRAT